MGTGVSSLARPCKSRQTCVFSILRFARQNLSKLDCDFEITGLLLTESELVGLARIQVDLGFRDWDNVPLEVIKIEIRAADFPCRVISVLESEMQLAQQRVRRMCEYIFFD